MWNGTWNSDKTTVTWMKWDAIDCRINIPRTTVVTGMKWDAIDWRISTKNNSSDRDEMGCY